MMNIIKLGIKKLFLVWLSIEVPTMMDMIQKLMKIQKIHLIRYVIGAKDINVIFVHQKKKCGLI